MSRINSWVATSRYALLAMTDGRGYALLAMTDGGGYALLAMTDGRAATLLTPSLRALRSRAWQPSFWNYEIDALKALIHQ